MDHDRRGGRAVPPLPVVRHELLAVGAGDEIDPHAPGERHADGNATPGLAHGADGITPRTSAAGVVAGRGIDPDLQEVGTADVVGREFGGGEGEPRLTAFGHEGLGPGAAVRPGAGKEWQRHASPPRRRRPANATGDRRLTSAPAPAFRFYAGGQGSPRSRSGLVWDIQGSPQARAGGSCVAIPPLASGLVGDGATARRG